MKCIILILFLLSVNPLVFGSSDNLDLQIQYDVISQNQSDNSNEYTDIFEIESMTVEEVFFQIHEDEVFSQEEIIIVGTFGGGGIFQNQDSLENRLIVDSESKNPFEEVLLDESEHDTIESYFQKESLNNNENDFIVGTFGGGGLRFQQPFIENEVGTSTEDKTIYEYFNNKVRKNQEVHSDDFDSIRNTYYIHQSPYFPRVQESQAMPLITGVFGGGEVLQFSPVSSKSGNNIFSNSNIGIFYRTEAQGQQKIPYRSFENLDFNINPSYGRSVQEIVGVFGGGGFIP